MLTNEETRAIEYYEDTPTIPSEVTPETPIEALNLSWREKDLPQKERTKHVHGIHPYLGKFIPQLVEIFLRRYFTPGQTILDPFCGCGTSLVQANELGLNAVGSDISAFNVLLCKVKTGKYDIRQAKAEIQDILKKTRAATRTTETIPQMRLWDSNIEISHSLETDNAYLNNWYATQTLKELLAYRYFIRTGDYEYKDLLKIILSRSARSARLTTHFDLDFPDEPQREPYWCYKHSRTCTPVQEAFKFLRRYSQDSLRRIKEFMMCRTDANVSIIHGDSRHIQYPSVDGVITSPPYVGLIDYHEQHIYAYNLLELEDRRKEEIGPASRGKSQKAKRQYQQGVAEVLSNSMRAMPKGGRLIVVAGDRHNLYEDIAEMIGVEEEGIVKRHVNRRTGRRSSEFYESVFIWRKP